MSADAVWVPLLRPLSVAFFSVAFLTVPSLQGVAVLCTPAGGGEGCGRHWENGSIAISRLRAHIPPAAEVSPTAL